MLHCTPTAGTRPRSGGLAELGLLHGHGSARTPVGRRGIAEHTRAVCSHTLAHALHRLDNTLAPFHPSSALHRR